MIVHAERTETLSLGGRLVLATLGFCFVFTLVTVAVRTWSAWNGGVAAMKSELGLIEQVYQATLSKAIWEMDREALQTHIASACRVAAVGRVEVRISSPHRATEVLGRNQDGWAPSGLAPARYVPLTYQPFPGSSETLGELVLYGDERLLWTRLRAEIGAIVITQVIQSLLLAGLITLLFTSSVTVHVRRIATHLAQLTPDNLAQALTLNRDSARRDELSSLVTGVNTLQGNLSDYLEQRKRDARELAEHRDRLAELVRERTAELEALAATQQAALTLSNRLIHAPDQDFDRHQLDCLRDVAQRIGVEHALWYVPKQDGGDYRLFLEWHAIPGRQAQPEGQWPILTAYLERTPLLGFCSRAALIEAVTATETVPFAALGIEACAFALLKGGAENFGFLVFGKPDLIREWGTNEQTLLAMTAQMLLQSARHKTQLRDIVETQLELRRVNARLEELSLSDALTELPNRRRFDEIKEVEFRRAIRTDSPLSLLMCDIDYFKHYNDTCGHMAGDQCLRLVAAAMRASVGRAGDLVARIGGEEFAILLPATGAATARKIAEQVRHAVEDLRIPHKDSAVAPHVTVSVGIATLDTDLMDSFDALFDLADQALYRAKANGRNQVAGPQT